MDRLARERHTQLMVKSKSQRRAHHRTDKFIATEDTLVDARMEVSDRRK